MICNVISKWFLLVFKMQERHDILDRTIGHLDEEQDALDNGRLLLIGSCTTMILGSFMELSFFYLYNGPYHPFTNILLH